MSLFVTHIIVAITEMHYPLHNYFHIYCLVFVKFQLASMNFCEQFFFLVEELSCGKKLLS